MTRVDWLVLLATTAGSGSLSLFLGQDANFDQLHYHVYLGWSLLAGRLGLDVAPAGLGSYLNPLLHVPSYLGVAGLPPRLFGLALGAVHGLNVYLVYRVALHLVRERPWARGHAVIAAVVAMLGPSAVALLGTTFGDNLLSLPVLAAFLLAVRAAGGPAGSAVRALFAAGVLAGAAFGLKLTFGPFLVGVAAASVVVAARRRSGKALLGFAGGATAGAVAAGGYWAWQMWSRFSNPVFPFTNPLLPSPFDGTTPLKPDARWASEGWVDALAAPVQMALGMTSRLQEVSFRDLRCLLALALVGVALTSASRLIRLPRPAMRVHHLRRSMRATARLWRRIAPDPAVPALVVGWLAAYVAWIRVFHYYRYFAAGEFLAPLVVLALVAALAPSRLRLIWPVAAATMLLSSTTGSWGRMPWRDDPLTLRYAPGARPPAPAAVIVDGPRLSYVLPFLPAGSRFFGIGTGSPGLDRLVAQEIGRHPGPFFRLIQPAAGPSDLGWLGLSDAGECAVVRTSGRGRVWLCPLARQP